MCNRSDDPDRIATAWELIKRAQHSLDDARTNASGDDCVPTLLESIAASLLAIAKRI
ncbi:hypothetical protein [Mycolicibacterium sp. 120270]|uniref:hypothetical protein n=1 Tax=Mycolicibacterium sp. 120270 TaxID=3090600 RepID=UPI00299EDEF0|nr:hypothetical protein [Mycolicibacterium sp. 120270]MDX1885822.1 hypothetical protein [Mycolicibacterium sp. 120270]